MTLQRAVDLLRSDELLIAYYRPQRSWRKVISSEACVKNSVHGGVVSQHVPPDRHPPRQTPPWVDTTPGQTPPLGRHPPLGQPPPLTHKVNERAVRILLECILVNGNDLLTAKQHHSTLNKKVIPSYNCIKNKECKP